MKSVIFAAKKDRCSAYITITIYNAIAALVASTFSSSDIVMSASQK